MSYSSSCIRYITIIRVPAPISTHPIRDFIVNSSCRKTNANTSVMTTLNLSIGTTFDFVFTHISVPISSQFSSVLYYNASLLSLLIFLNHIHQLIYFLVLLRLPFCFLSHLILHNSLHDKPLILGTKHTYAHEKIINVISVYKQAPTF